MADIAYDDALFRAQCPAYADMTAYPEALLSVYWTSATSFVSNCTYGFLPIPARTLGINWMAAHLIAIAGLVAAGQVPGIVNNATIDKISIGLVEAPKPNQWQWFLNQTAYGQQLLALLQVNSVGGYIVGGSPVSQSFNRPGGFALGCFR